MDSKDSPVFRQALPAGEVWRSAAASPGPAAVVSSPAGRFADGVFRLWRRVVRTNRRTRRRPLELPPARPLRLYSSQTDILEEENR